VIKNERPSPEPQRPESRRSPGSTFPSARLGGDAKGRIPVVGYTPLTQTDSTGRGHRTKKNRILGAVAAVSIAVIGVGLLVTNQNKPPPPPRSAPIASIVQSDTTLFVSDRDLDVEATESAKAALKRGRIPPSLANVPEKTRQEISSGEQSLYTVWIFDFSHIGDSVDVLLNDTYFSTLVEASVDKDGVPAGSNNDRPPGYGRYAPQGFSSVKLTIPLGKGSTTKIAFRAKVNAGEGGVRFRAVSSRGEMRTRILAVGESESWTVSFK